MKICFVANFTKTYFFHAIAKELIDKHGFEVFWIVVNRKNYDFLLEHYPAGNIIYLSKSNMLANPQAPVDNYKLNELIWGDRVSKFHYDTAFSFLTNIQKPVYDFIQENKPAYIFGEVTWAHELLIMRIMKDRTELNCKFLNPHTVRIPSGMFTFFEDEFQSKIYITDKGFNEKAFPAKAFEPKKPDYLALNDKILKANNSVKGRLRRLTNYLTSRNLDENDISLPVSRSLSRTLTPLNNELNKETYKAIKKVDIDFVKDKKFVLVTLHKQPEASVDVLGRYVEDQFVNITNLWKLLPHDWWLVVKEHTNAVGDRSASFYKDLARLKNVVFIDEKTDSYKIMEYSKAIFTISGTIAYEAALMNKKALVMCDVFFRFSNVKLLTTDDFKNSKNLECILDKIPDEKVDDEKLKREIYFNSFEGIISDPLSNKACVEMENIEKVKKAFLKLT